MKTPKLRAFKGDKVTYFDKFKPEKGIVKSISDEYPVRPSLVLGRIRYAYGHRLRFAKPCSSPG